MILKMQRYRFEEIIDGIYINYVITLTEFT